MPDSVTHVPGLICHQCRRSGPQISLDSFFESHRPQARIVQQMPFPHGRHPPGRAFKGGGAKIWDTR